MFLTFTPNPCIERTVRIQNFAVGSSFRIAPHELRVSAGGKGLNAARVARRFGASSCVLAPIGQWELPFFHAMLTQDGIEADFIEVSTPTRTCSALVHAEGELTEILEAGSPLPISAGTAILERWRDLLPQCELAAIGGSYPPATDGGWIYHPSLLCSLAHQAGKKLIYDGKGDGWRRALFSKTPPWAVKPNLDEMRELWRRTIETEAEERRAVRDLLNRGVQVVLMSCGARGLYVGYNDQIEFLVAPTVETVSPVGSGDSLVGAFAAKYLETGNVWEAAQWGVAAGTANANRFEASQVGPEEVAPLVGAVKRRVAEIRLSLG